MSMTVNEFHIFFDNSFHYTLFSYSIFSCFSFNLCISQEQLTQESMEGVEAAEGQTS